MNEVTEPVRPKRNAFLIHTKDGEVTHTFLPASEAHAQFGAMQRNHAGGSVLALDLHWDAEDYPEISPEFRDRLASARSRLALGLKWNEIMDRNGVPSDQGIRAKVLKAAQEIVSKTLGDWMPRQ